MNPKVKIKQQAIQLKKIRAINAALSEMIRLCIQALNYIAGKDLQKTIVSIQEASEPRIPATQVAMECLEAVVITRQSLDQILPEIENEEIKRVELQDGGELPIPNEVDVVFHECCDCGLIHEVRIERQEDKMITRWYRTGSLPTVEEIEAQGGTVLQ